MENSNQESRLERLEAMQEIITKNFVQMQENHLQMQTQMREDRLQMQAQLRASQEKSDALLNELHNVIIKMMATDEIALAGVREIESTIQQTAKVLSKHKYVLSK